MTSHDLAHIPGRSHYSLKYFQSGRVFSCAHQIDTVLSFEPRRVLEVGVGAGVVAAALRAMGIDVTTVDIQPELKPDIVGSVTELPVDDGAFDVVLCSQVLEHLPFDQFVPALGELRRVARRGAVVSVPDVTRSGFIAAKLPRMRRFSIWWTLPRLRPRAVPQSRFESSGHYWEIGFRGYPPAGIRRAMRRAGWAIASDWRVPELPWHHFYRLKK